MAENLNFHEALERDLQRLGAEIKERRAVPEFKDLSEKDIVKKSIREFAAAYPQPAPNLSAPSLPTYLQSDKTDPAVKLAVEQLLDLVFHKGLVEAVKSAKRYPPFIEDAFHDALVDKLLPELKRRGVL